MTRKKKPETERPNMKEIPGFNGELFATADGEIFSSRSKKVLRATQNARGYLRITLWRGSGLGSRNTGVHRLVAAAYLGESTLHVNHINGVKADNRPDNLEYCTPAENNSHAREVLGFNPRQRASLGDIQYLTLLSMTNKSNKEMAQHYRLPRNTISFIRSGKGYEQYGLTEWAKSARYLRLSRTGKPRYNSPHDLRPGFVFDITERV